MKCDCCVNEATIEATFNTEYKALCDECFDVRFVYNRTTNTCHYCGRPLNGEIYTDCRFHEYCSWYCAVRANGFKRLTDKGVSR